MLITRSIAVRPQVGASVFGAVAGGLLFLMAHEALSDDAYITMSYARNLAEHGHWGLLADRVSNTQTSPLNAWLVALGVVLTGKPVVAAGLVFVVSLAAVGWWGAGLGAWVDQQRGTTGPLRVAAILPALLVGLLASSPLLASTVGLEAMLGAAVLVGTTRYAVAGRAVVAGALCGLAVLTRPDLAVPAGVLLFVLLPGPRRWLMGAGVAAAVSVPWHLFAWFTLGGFVPDTVWFKSGETWTVRGEVYTFAEGWLLYGRDFTLASVLALAPVIMGLVAAVGWAVRGQNSPIRRVALSSAAAGVAHWCAIAALGTPPYAWYLAPSLVCLTLCAAITAATVRRRVGLPVLGAVIAGSAVFLASWGWTMGPIAYNWATPAQYARIGTDISTITAGQPVLADWEIGTTAYFCRCPLLDGFGDRALADRLIAERSHDAGPVKRWLMGLNFAHRRSTPPPDVGFHLGPGRDPQAVAQWVVSTPARGVFPASLTPF